MSDWLRNHRQSILVKWLAGGEEFPFFAALRHRQLRAIVNREFDGLLSFIGSDSAGLEGATQTHKQQADDFMRGAPVDQPLGFLESRMTVCRDALAGDPEAASFRDRFIEKMEHASRYYKTIVRSIDIEQRFSVIS